MARTTGLKQCTSCKTRPAIGGLVRSFYLLKAAGQIEGKQVKGSLPTLGYCCECLLDLAAKAGPEDSVAMLQAVCPKSKARSPAEVRRESKRVKAEVRQKRNQD